VSCHVTVLLKFYVHLKAELFYHHNVLNAGLCLKILLRLTSNWIVHFICAVVINYLLTFPSSHSYFVEIVNMRDTVWRSFRNDIIPFFYIYKLWACHWIGCGCLSCTVSCSFIWYHAAL